MMLRMMQGLQGTPVHDTAPQPKGPTKEEEMMANFRKFMGMIGGGGGDNDEGEQASDSAPPEETDTQSQALKVMKFLEDFKANDGTDGETIYESGGVLITRVAMANGYRYTLNKDLVVDANLYRDELYFHLKKKVPKRV